MTIRWDPDDPRWLSVEPDIQPVDLHVLRQVGVPELVLQLAMRRARSGPGNRPGGFAVGGSPSLAFLDRPAEEDEPYWRDETSCDDYRRW